MILLLLALKLVSTDLGPIDLQVARIVVYDHFDDQTLAQMYRVLMCFDEDGWTVGSVVVKPDALPLREYVFRERFTNKRWRLRFHDQEYLGSTVSPREMFPKQIPIEYQFNLREGY